MPGARHCYPAQHCCKQLISNSIDLELRANSTELIANSIQTGGARLSLALPPEKASSLWTDKRRRSKRTLKARNLHTFTSASAKQLQHHTLCIDHQRFVTPELNTAPRQNTELALHPEHSSLNSSPLSHPTTWNISKQKAQCGGFPPAGAVLKVPKKSSHPLQTDQHFSDPTDPTLPTPFSQPGSVIEMCPRASAKEGHRCCAAPSNCISIPARISVISQRERDLQFSFCRKTHLFLSSTRLIPCLAACS